MLMLELPATQQTFRRGSIWRGKNDFYRTPEGATRALVKLRILPEIVYEPACGDGAIALILDATGHDVYMTDLIDRGCGIGGVDFLKGWRPEITYSGNSWAIVTNPPYGLANEFVEQALRHDPDVVAMLLPLKFLEGAKRYRQLHSVRPPTDVYVFIDRLKFYAGDYVGEQPGWNTESFAWFVWCRWIPNRPPQVHWISRGNE